MYMGLDNRMNMKEKFRWCNYHLAKIYVEFFAEQPTSFSTSEYGGRLPKILLEVTGKIDSGNPPINENPEFHLQVTAY